MTKGPASPNVIVAVDPSVPDPTTPIPASKYPIYMSKVTVTTPTPGPQTACVKMDDGK